LQSTVHSKVTIAPHGPDPAKPCTEL